MDFRVAPAADALERGQVEDLRRSVLCGELDWPREVVNDPADLPESGGVPALAWLGAKAVATARLARRGEEWCLEALAVLPAFRRRGLGRRMVSFLEAEAMARGAEELRLICPAQACPFFLKLAYKDGGGMENLSLAPGWKALIKKLSTSSPLNLNS